MSRGPLICGFLNDGHWAWVCGFVALCVSAVIAADAEPSHNGRPLSDWLADVRAGPGFSIVGRPNPPKDAVRAMGTNAIPTLLKWISYERSPSDNFPPAPEVPHWRWHTLNPDELGDAADSGFGFLGPVALPAIPELVRLARTSSGPDRAERCAVALAAIGPEAIPNLLSLATNGPSWTRYWAVSALEFFSHKPEGVQTMPILIKCLGDTNSGYSPAGPAQLVLLNLLDTAPAATLPALTNALESPSARTRLNSIGCLQLFQSENPTNLPPSTAPAFSAALHDSDSIVASIATNILRQMGQSEAPAANQHLQPTPR
jgi:hypothetical protein